MQMPLDGTKTLKPILAIVAALALAGGLFVPAPASADLYDGTPLNPGPGGQTSPFGAFDYDNIVYEEFGSTDVLDTYGILVSFAGTANLEGNIWGNGGTSYSYYTGPNAGNYPISDTNDTFSITAAPDPPSDPGPDPAPEPTTLALLGSGLIGLAVVVRRRWV
jgi:hypothetical protein